MYMKNAFLIISKPSTPKFNFRINFHSKPCRERGSRCRPEVFTNSLKDTIFLIDLKGAEE